jgi:glycosyltransferase involved in cell wall biosynthesis
MVQLDESPDSAGRKPRRKRNSEAPAPAGPGPLKGHLDLVDAERIEGWALDEASPETPVLLRILDNGTIIAEIAADRPRADLKLAGVGNGLNAFSFKVPGGLNPLLRHLIKVERASDGREIANSPWLFEPAANAISPTAGAPVVHHPTCQGHVDEATRRQVAGWAFDTEYPERPMTLQILDNGEPIAHVIANRYRQNLRLPGMQGSRYAFKVDIPGGLNPYIRHVIQIRRARDGAELPGSPVIVPRADSFDESLEQAVSSAIDSLASPNARRRAISFLVDQTERVLRGMAEADSQRADRQTYQDFIRRWGPQADSAPLSPPDPGKRALVIDERLPARDRDAGSTAILSHVRALRSLGHSVTFVAVEEMSGAEEAVAGLEEEKVTVCRAPFYTSAEDVLRRQADCFDVIYLHRAEMASRYLALARRYCPRARILYSLADLHHVRLARQADVEGQPEWRAASQRLQLMEFSSAWLADAVITHSSEEARLLRQSVPRAQVHVVPWEVALRPVPPPLAKRRGIAFIGGYSHRPNIDAAFWLVQTVMPLVWEESPEIECLLVGSGMPESVANLARPGVVPVGFVQDLDIGVFDRVRLTIAPLRYGAGVKGKVLESFAAGVPCVMTEVAAEGIPLPSTLLSLVGRDPPALARIIRMLHDDMRANEDAAEAGVRMILERFTAETTIRAIAAAMDGRAPQPESTPT